MHSDLSRHIGLNVPRSSDPVGSTFFQFPTLGLSLGRRILPGIPRIAELAAREHQDSKISTSLQVHVESVHVGSGVH